MAYMRVHTEGTLDVKRKGANPCLSSQENQTIALASEQPNPSHLLKGALLHPRYSRARDHVAPAAANRHADCENGR